MIFYGTSVDIVRNLLPVFQRKAKIEFLPRRSIPYEEFSRSVQETTENRVLVLEEFKRHHERYTWRHLVPVFRGQAEIEFLPQSLIKRQEFKSGVYGTNESRVLATRKHKVTGISEEMFIRK